MSDPRRFFCVDLPEGITGEREHEVRQEEEDFIRVCRLLHVLQTAKGVGYGRSWCKRGLKGAFFTMARPWDRLEGQILLGREAAQDQPIEETVGDLAIYAVKMLAYIFETVPGSEARWLAKMTEFVEKSGCSAGGDGRG